MKTTKIGIIICDRYRTCAGGKCFRAMQKREGAFNIYPIEDDLRLVGYTTCGGCPGGNIEYSIDAMKKNGAETIHLATGFVVGYPPCPYIDHFKELIEKKDNIKVMIGTHPIPEKYRVNHEKLGTWDSEKWKQLTSPSMADESTRLAYN